MEILSKYSQRGYYIAIAAGLIGATADVLLLYNSTGGYDDLTYRFYFGIDSDRLMWGHYLGIFFIPLQLLGMARVYERMKNVPAEYLTVLGLTVFMTLVPGVVYHGTCAFAGSMMQYGKETNLIDSPAFQQMFQQAKNLFEPLGYGLFAGFALLSGMISYAVYRWNTAYHKSIALLTPISFYVIFAILYKVLPIVGNMLMPAGFNLSFVLFFLISEKMIKKEG